jgi:hypothetical protein
MTYKYFTDVPYSPEKKLHDCTVFEAMQKIVIMKDEKMPDSKVSTRILPTCMDSVIDNIQSNPENKKVVVNVLSSGKRGKSNYDSIETSRSKCSRSDIMRICTRLGHAIFENKDENKQMLATGITNRSKAVTREDCIKNSLNIHPIFDNDWRMLHTQNSIYLLPFVKEWINTYCRVLGFTAQDLGIYFFCLGALQVNEGLYPTWMVEDLEGIVKTSEYELGVRRDRQNANI